MLQGVVDPVAREQPEREREQARQERDDKRLHLQEGQVSGDKCATSRAQVELADVGLSRGVDSIAISATGWRGAKASRGGEGTASARAYRGREPGREVALDVALEVEQDRNEDEELLDPDEDRPQLQPLEEHARQDRAQQCDDQDGERLQRMLVSSALTQLHPSGLRVMHTCVTISVKNARLSCLAIP